MGMEGWGEKCFLSQGVGDLTGPSEPWIQWDSFTRLEGSAGEEGRRSQRWGGVSTHPCKRPKQPGLGPVGHSSSPSMPQNLCPQPFTPNTRFSSQHPFLCETHHLAGFSFRYMWVPFQRLAVYEIQPSRGWAFHVLNSPRERGVSIHSFLSHKNP